MKRRVTLFLEEDVYVKLKMTSFSKGITMSKLMGEYLNDKQSSEPPILPVETFIKKQPVTPKPKVEKTFVRERGEMDPDDYV